VVYEEDSGVIEDVQRRVRPKAERTRP